MIEGSFTTNLSQAGPDRKLRPSALLALMTEAAAIDLEGLGAGVDEITKRGYLWVVVKNYVEITRMPDYGESVEICSQPGKTRYVIFPRFFTMTDSSGNELVRSSSEWVLVDKNERRFVFPNEAGISINSDDPGNALPLPPAIRRKECQNYATVTVPGSYADINGHLNNARYLDLIEDTLPPMGERVLSSISIEYDAEILPRSCFTLGWSIEGNSVYVSGDRDKHLFRAELKYK